MFLNAINSVIPFIVAPPHISIELLHFELCKETQKLLNASTHLLRCLYCRFL